MGCGAGRVAGSAGVSSSVVRPHPADVHMRHHRIAKAILAHGEPGEGGGGRVELEERSVRRYGCVNVLLRHTYVKAIFSCEGLLSST